ncbi:hypothetical protein Bca4012_015280 [Brassica carinata]
MKNSRPPQSPRKHKMRSEEVVWTQIRNRLDEKRNLEQEGKKTLTIVTDQKSTRCEEKSGTGDDLGGQYTEKLPILTKLPSPCPLGRIPAVSLARDVVYSTSSSTMITTEIMIDQ